MGQVLRLEAVVRVLHPVGERFEVRLLHCGAEGTVAGVFDDPTLVAGTVAPYDGVAAGCYVTLNSLTQWGQGSESADARTLATRPLTTRSTRRRWLLLDFDPDRGDPLTGAMLCQTDAGGRPIVGRDGKPKKLKCPSTDAELAAPSPVVTGAHRFFVEELGWPGGLRGMSGNGAHILFRGRVCRTTRGRFRPGQPGLEVPPPRRFGGDGVNVDLTVFNASAHYEVLRDTG